MTRKKELRRLLDDRDQQISRLVQTITVYEQTASGGCVLGPHCRHCENRLDDRIEYHSPSYGQSFTTRSLCKLQSPCKNFSLKESPTTDK